MPAESTNQRRAALKLINDDFGPNRRIVECCAISINNELDHHGLPCVGSETHCSRLNARTLNCLVKDLLTVNEHQEIDTCVCRICSRGCWWQVRQTIEETQR